MIGGFLGAGKTTAIARLARHYMDQGRRVGIVTNDQAYGLVDTQSLRDQGFNVGEVPGACFCCKFQDLVETVATLRREQRPEVILAEPVGSCTDLVATVIEPMRAMYGDDYEVGPLAVLFKPEHGRKILRAESGGGFSPQAEYIFLKQLEEADIIAVNKTDKLSTVEREELLRLVHDRFPGKDVLAVSSRTGDGVDQLISALETPRDARDAMIDVDYDVYAAGEAELGWLNCSVTLQARDDQPFHLDNALLDLLRELSASMVHENVEPAHLKIYGQSGSNSAVVNLVDSTTEAELSIASGVETSRAELIVNARVAADPALLEKMIREALGHHASAHDRKCVVEEVQAFRPGRPVPTHRVTNS